MSEPDGAGHRSYRRERITLLKVIAGASALVGLATGVVTLANTWDEHKKDVKEIVSSASAAAPVVSISFSPSVSDTPTLSPRNSSTVPVAPPNDAVVAQAALLTSADLGSSWIPAGAFSVVPSPCSGTEPYLAVRTDRFNILNSQGVHIDLDESVRSYSNQGSAQTAVNQDRNLTTRLCSMTQSAGVVGESIAASQAPPTACSGGDFLADNIYLDGHLIGYDEEVQCGRWVIEASTYSDDSGFQATPTAALQTMNVAATKAAQRLPA